MNKLIAKIDDLLYEIINYYYISKKEAENKLENISRPLIYHLIKILKWKDHVNYEKHIDDINNWLLECQDREIKGKRISKDTYKKLLFTTFIPSFEKFERKINSVYFKDYAKLTIIRTNAEVYSIIMKFADKLCEDLSKDTFNNIEDYL